MKVAEDSPNTSSVISKMIEEFFPPEYIAVVNGDKEVATELLEQKMDYIFFTGACDYQVTGFDQLVDTVDFQDPLWQW